MIVKAAGRCAPLLIVLGLGACAAPNPEKSTQRFLHATMLDESVITPASKNDPNVKANRDAVSKMQHGRVVVDQAQGTLVTTPDNKSAS